MCPNAYIGKVDNRDRVLCRKQNDKICPFVRWCNNANCWKPLQSQKICRLRTEYKIPDGAFEVRFEKKGELYIETNDSVVVLKNPFEFIPKYVTLVKKDNDYIIDKNNGFGK